MYPSEMRLLLVTPVKRGAKKIIIIAVKMWKAAHKAHWKKRRVEWVARSFLSSSLKNGKVEGERDFVSTGLLGAL